MSKARIIHTEHEHALVTAVGQPPKTCGSEWQVEKPLQLFRSPTLTGSRAQWSILVDVGPSANPAKKAEHRLATSAYATCGRCSLGRLNFSDSIARRSPDSTRDKVTSP